MVVNDLDQPVLMVAIGNGANVGGGTELTPDADPEDGLLDVMISRAVSPRRSSGTSPSCARASTRSATTCSTSAAARSQVSGEEFWVSADGEIYGPERSRTWRLEPAAYSMVLP